ncbi:MAG: hypothetical protein AB1405_03325 [Bdellovibrionota bacterium]
MKSQTKVYGGRLAAVQGNSVVFASVYALFPGEAHHFASGLPPGQVAHSLDSMDDTSPRQTSPGAFDHIEALSRRRRWFWLNVAGAAALLAAGGFLFWRYYWNPALRPIDGAELGRQLDEAYYYPQHAGLREVRATFHCEFLTAILQHWMVQNGIPEEEAAKGHVEVEYLWREGVGIQVDLPGWPENIQTLERKRYIKVVRDLVELIVPPTQEAFLSFYEVWYRKLPDGYEIVGRGNGEAPLDGFRKFVSEDASEAVIEGVGPNAKFTTATKFTSIGGRRVVEQQKFTVAVETVTLRYTVTPVYNEFQGILLPERITLVYEDAQAAPVAEPMDMVAATMEVIR